MASSAPRIAALLLGMLASGLLIAQESSSFRITLATRAEQLSIQHAGGGFRRSREKRDRAAAAAQVGYDDPDVRAALEAELMSLVCAQLAPRCDNDGGNVDVGLHVEFLGYRFDQIANTAYAPTVIVRAVAAREGTVLFDETIGSGNVGRLKGIDKADRVKGYNYKAPGQVAIDNARSYEGLREAVVQVAIKLTDELLDEMD